MSKQPRPFHAIVISDFNNDVFSGLLKNDLTSPVVSVVTPPFGQVIPVLHQGAQAYGENLEIAIIWTQPQAIAHNFQQLFHGENVPEDALLSEVDAFAEVVKHFSKSLTAVFIPQWVLPTYVRGYGLLELRKNKGLTRQLLAMNARLLEAFDSVDNIFVLNTQKWIEPSGKYAYNPKLWYMGKIPFDTSVFKEACRDIKAAMRALSGDIKKLVVVDLDNTLWGGVLGDLGWQNLILGGHDPAGEAFVDFQKSLKALQNRGILLAISSKNDASVALEALTEHPEMILRPSDFAAWRINWNDKAANIADLVTELNLGLSSVVFIDDNPAERGRVREALPEIFVPDWPEDKFLYTKTLLELSCFDSPHLSREDISRTQMMWDERSRRAIKEQLGSTDAWLKSLDIQVRVEELNEANLERATQLFNKTNQMNLTTRRLTALELMAWAQQKNHKVWTFRVSDKFGDSGLTGIASVSVENDASILTDFILSCRVFGRKIEEAMMHTVTEYVHTLQVRKIMAHYLPTAKNQPCLEFFKKSGLDFNEAANLFVWDTSNPYPRPEISIL